MKPKANTAMDWAHMAKNTKPELCFGLPSLLTDKPPGIEGKTKSEWGEKHNSALHASRKAFKEAEYSERIRWALREQISHLEEKYEAETKYTTRDWTVLIGKEQELPVVRMAQWCLSYMEDPSSGYIISD